MRRLQVVATVVLAVALALVLAGWRNVGDRADKASIAAEQKKLEQAYREGAAARASMGKIGQQATQAECEARFFATRALDLEDETMVELACKYFVAGCMRQPPPASVARAP
jgi:type II secretory pathway pseudopilin PulG